MKLYMVMIDEDEECTLWQEEESDHECPTAIERAHYLVFAANADAAARAVYDMPERADCKPRTKRFVVMRTKDDAVIRMISEGGSSGRDEDDLWTFMDLFVDRGEEITLV